MSIFCLRIHLGLHLTDGLEGRRGSPKVLQQASGKARAEPNLPLPAPWVTAFLNLLLCKGTAPVARWRPLHLTTPLPHPVCPFPPCFQGCLHGLPAHVLTRVCVHVLGNGFLWVCSGGSWEYCTRRSTSPTALAHQATQPTPFPQPSQCSTLSGKGGCRVNSRRTFFVSGSGDFSVSPFPPSASPMGLRTSAASVWCVLSSNQRLEKVYFVLFPSALPGGLGTQP